ncbi:MAG: hypothetical protein MUF02_06410 [Acidobacteria bacterium]|nr:hypothetical protein [Acidobacteriota bacterium]
MASLAKLLVIAALFFAASRFSAAGAAFFVQGLMMIYLGVVGSGLRRATRGKRHGA